MSDALKDLLDSYNVNTLAEIGSEASLLPKTGKRPGKASMIDILKAGLFTEARVKRAYSQLDEREKGVLNRLLWHPDGIATRVFERECVRARLVRPAPEESPSTGRYNPNVPYADYNEYIGDYTRADSAIFTDVIARLTWRGLVFSRLPVEMVNNAATNYRLQFHPGEQLFVPQAVRRHLPPPTPVTDDATAWTPTRIEGGDPGFLLRELYIYWDYTRRNEVQLLQNGLVGKRALKAINQALMAPDPRFEQAANENDTSKILSLRLLLQALGLVKALPGRLAVTNENQAAMPDLWTQDLPAQIMSVLRAWLGLARDPTLDSDLLRLGPNLQAGRQALLNLLKGRKPEVWFEPDDLVDLLRSRSVNFLFAERSQFENRKYNNNYYSTYWAGSYYGSVSALLKQLDAAERKFVYHTLASLPHTLGLVELGYDERNPQVYYAARLTPLGATVLAHYDTPSGTQGLSGAALAQLPTADQGRVVLQPNFQILAMGPVKLSTLARLDVFAERRKTDVGATEYHLSRESVYKAQQAHMSVDEIVAFLNEATGVDLPQNVQRSLAEWAAQHERITFRPGATLLQAANAEALNDLLANKSIGSHLARSLAPDVALVKSRHQQRIIESLLERGLLPAVSDDQPSSANHSVIIDSQGHIQPVHAVPSLHLNGRLARFAERADGKTWRMTPDSIRRAATDRQKVLDLIRELAKLQRGPLPPAVEEMVKREGAYYGDAAVETLTLLEFRDRQALDELLKEPTLKRLLTRFPAGDRALALVDAAKLADIERRLGELGVAVKRGIVK